MVRRAWRIADYQQGKGYLSCRQKQNQTHPILLSRLQRRKPKNSKHRQLLQNPVSSPSKITGRAANRSLHIPHRMHQQLQHQAPHLPHHIRLNQPKKPNDTRIRLTERSSKNATERQTQQFPFIAAVVVAFFA
jgi:hypothetical protein